MNLEQAVAIAPFMKDYYDEDVSVFICSRDKVVFSLNHENLDLGVRQDDPAVKYEKTVTMRSLREEKRLVVRVPMEKSQFGLSYIAIANPLRNNGEVEGAMSVVMSDKRFDTLKKAGLELSELVNSSYISSEELSAASEELAATAKSMENSSLEAKDGLEQINGISEDIRRISAQTSILGLNASIEAARAGDKGRGFAVVAEEVRKLSEGTKLSAFEISKDVVAVNDKVNRLIDSVKQLALVSENQALGVVNLTQTLSEIAKLAQKFESDSNV